eukprot:638913-Pleurochrysis_carterae.AAC.1
MLRCLPRVAPPCFVACPASLHHASLLAPPSLSLPPDKVAQSAARAVPPGDHCATGEVQVRAVPQLDDDVAAARRAGRQLQDCHGGHHVA